MPKYPRVAFVKIGWLEEYRGEPEVVNDFETSTWRI
jgi:hypothetical protein